MAYEQLNILINPGDNLRKYYLFKGLNLRASALFYKDTSSHKISFRGTDSKDETLECNPEDSF